MIQTKRSNMTELAPNLDRICAIFSVHTTSEFPR
uniref:Uncharacterized protein n=1 Tax=Rhizophora mucronata TaxID=61149 RepID=A0A2P2PCM9_RHIMU